MNALMDREFWAMSGYALYVWGSFGLTAAVVIWNWWAPRQRRRSLMDMEGEE